VLCQIGRDKIWNGGEDKTIKVWSTLDMSCHETLKGHKGPVYCMVHMDLNVWTRSTDSNILLWDVESYELLFILGEQGGY
jgi:WD40 repeat protein